MAPRPIPLDLAARAPAVTFEAPYVESTRSSPVTDAEATALSRFIEYLTASEHADEDPRLMAIGFEIEALLAIYPDAVRLSVVSRPGSEASGSPRSSAELGRPPRDFINATEIDASRPSAASRAGPMSVPMSAGTVASRSSYDSLHESAVDPTDRIRYEVMLPAWEAGDKLDGVNERDMPSEPPQMRVLVSLPPTYPSTSPPQLQLLGRYLGSFPIDVALFGDVTRTYISSTGVAFNSNDVCVFEGLQHVQHLARSWYASRLSEGVDGERQREAARQQGSQGRAFGDVAVDAEQVDESATVAALAAMSLSPARPSPSRANFSYSHDQPRVDFDIVSSEPIVDRKSTFIGHAVKVTDERDVPLVVHELLSDRKIAKAAHPAIFAYRIARDVGGVAGKVYISDFDDDGESQAGARLKHLLDILELENVLVVVSRWYGGVHLGPDRFKHINQAARDALELAGFLEESKKSSRRK